LFTCHFTALLLLTFLILVGPGSAVKTDGDYRQFTIIPYVTSTNHNSTVINWYPQTFIPDELFYANESFYNKTGSYDHSVRANNTSLPHKISLSGLESGTRYHYAVQQDGTTVINQSFMTFAEKGACSFIVYGDTREQAPYFTQLERHRIVEDRIANESNISFIINTGDLVNNPDDEDEWDRFFTAGKMLFARTTYAAVRGNHDSNRSLFKDRFGTDGMYSFDCGDAHIAVLDSTDYSGFSFDEQVLWLEKDLASTEKWKIVVLHHPLYTSEENHLGGFANLQKAFEPVFLSRNVSVVFNGHVHAYERIEKSGITYITEGRGGAPAYTLNETKTAGSVKSRENTLGYSRVTIDPETESLSIDVIQVADVSSDLRNVTQIYQRDTVVDSIILSKPDKKNNQYMHSSTPQLPLSGVFRCNNTINPIKHDISPSHIPSCIVSGFQEQE
jgi:predicted phosphodiesterase